MITETEIAIPVQISEVNHEKETDYIHQQTQHTQEKNKPEYF